MNLLTVFFIILNLNISPIEKLDLIPNALLNQYDLNFCLSQYDIYKLDRNPKWRGNLEGFGVYDYGNYSVYFNDIIGSYEDIFVDVISKKNYPHHFVFKNIQSTKNDKTTMIESLGVPTDSKKYANDDFYGNVEVCTYESGNYLVSFQIEDEEIKNVEVKEK
jgi:hypothetical protein